MKSEPLKVIARERNMDKRVDKRGETWFLTLEIHLPAKVRDKIAGVSQRQARKEQMKNKKQSQPSGA